jgi:hypothetical protein
MVFICCEKENDVHELFFALPQTNEYLNKTNGEKANFPSSSLHTRSGSLQMPVKVNKRLKRTKACVDLPSTASSPSRQLTPPVHSLKDRETFELVPQPGIMAGCVSALFPPVTALRARDGPPLTSLALFPPVLPLRFPCPPSPLLVEAGFSTPPHGGSGGLQGQSEAGQDGKVGD